MAAALCVDFYLECLVLDSEVGVVIPDHAVRSPEPGPFGGGVS